MEDQPTDSGDLTTDAAAAEETPASQSRHRMPHGKARRTLRAESDEGRPAPEADETPVEEPASVESEGETTESAEATAEDDPILVPHQPAGRRLWIAAVAAAGLFVAGGAFAGAMVQPVLADRALVDTKLDIARTAQAAITTLWSYTPDNMDSLADRSAGYLTGNFASEYRKFIDSIVATNKQAQVTNTTSVLGTAVESVTPSDATAIVYTNSVATSPVSKNIPSLRYLSYRLEMKRDDGKWRVTRMTTVTTLDLTPKL